MNAILDSLELSKSELLVGIGLGILVLVRLFFWRPYRDPFELPESSGGRISLKDPLRTRLAQEAVQFKIKSVLMILFSASLIIGWNYAHSHFYNLPLDIWLLSAPVKFWAFSFLSFALLYFPIHDFQMKKGEIAKFCRSKELVFSPETMDICTLLLSSERRRRQWINSGKAYVSIPWVSIHSLKLGPENLHIVFGADREEIFLPRSFFYGIEANFLTKVSGYLPTLVRRQLDQQIERTLYAA